jgi:hypothetical protein
MGAKNSKSKKSQNNDDADSGPDDVPLPLPDIPETEVPTEPHIPLEEMRATWVALGSEKWREVLKPILNAKSGLEPKALLHNTLHCIAFHYIR